MFYEITTEVKQITWNEVNPDCITVGIISLEELETYNHIFEFSESTLAECTSLSKNLRSTIDVYDEYSFGILNIINTKDVFGDRDKIGFYLKNNLFLIVNIMDENNSVTEIMEELFTRLNFKKVTLEKIIFSFLSRLIYENNIVLENLELKINDFEKKLLQGRIKYFNSDVNLIRKQLLLLYNYFEQLIDIGQELEENENDIFNDNNLRYFKIFTDRVTRLSSNTQMLKDYIVQVRDAYQEQLNYNLNSSMKLFTVVTAIFLPLNLLVGWYGMNFENMPELRWKYGYPSVVALSIILVLLCVLWMKKKKLL